MLNFNERFLTDIKSVNDLFSLLEIKEKLRKIDNESEIKKICKFPIGLNDKGNYVMVVTFYDENDLDYDYIDEVVSIIEKKFNKKVIVQLISKKPPIKPIGFFSRKEVESMDITHILNNDYKNKKDSFFDLGGIFNKNENSIDQISKTRDYITVKSRNSNLLKNLEINKKFSCTVEEMNNLFKRLDIDEELVEIEKSHKNKSIINEIGNNFVAFNKEDECVIVDNAIINDNDEFDVDMFDELAYKLWEHFQKPVKAIVICPYLDKKKSGFYIHYINFDFTQ